MDRILIYTIKQEDAGIRIDQYLKRRGFSSQILTRLRQSMELTQLNGHPSRLIDLLCCGDCLTVHLIEQKPSEHIPPVELPISIIYEDEDIVVINKPAGMPIHPSQGNYYNSLANGLAWYYSQKRETFVFRCTNRLDRDTSGLTVIAKNMLSAAILSDMGKCHKIRREYLAIVRGSLTPACGTITAPLSRKPGSILERTIDFKHGESAITHYKLIEQKNGYSLVSLLLETGRTHQIRIHMKYIGFPLIGDYLYNPDTERINRQALHSYRLSFSHPVTKKPLDFTAPLPEDMAHVFNN